MVEYKKFKINEFFKVLRVRHKLTKSQLLSDGKYTCYSSETSNYGILGYTNTPEFHVDDDHSYLIFGDHTRSMRIAETDFSVLDNVKVLKGPKLSREILLYIETAWHKGIRDMGYARHWKIAKQSDFLLPVTSAGQPDFEYMTQYIKDMEWQCVDDLKAKQKEELQAYLQVTGFTDMTLSSSEAAALTKKVVWKKFRIGDVFDIHPSVRKINANAVKFNGHYPYVARGISTNGIRGYIDWDTTDLNPANTISFGQDTATIYYQDKPYFTGDKIQIFELKDNFPELNPSIAQFFITCLNAVFGSYSWGQQSFAVKKLRNADFMLPINANNQIDFIYMQNYIRAIEKQTIKNVVKYRNDVIKTTQQVVDPTV